MAATCNQKREYDGKYAFDGRLDRLCVCGHTLAVHSSGSPPDCIFYNLPKVEQAGKPGEAKPDCGCLKFKQSKRKGTQHETD